MRIARRFAKPLLAAVILGGLGCGATIEVGTLDGGRTGDGAGGGSDAFVGAGGITITPLETTVDVTLGGPAATAMFQATANGPMGMQDVTGMAVWTVDDRTLGTFSGGAGVFTAPAPGAMGPVHGGTTTVRASWMGLGGFATVHVKVHARIDGGCPNCPKLPDPGMGAKPCGGGVMAPSVVYPPDGVLLPPNMNVLEVQYAPSGGTSYEVDFESDALDLRVPQACNPVADTRKSPTGGCGYALDQAAWDLLASSSRGGAAVKVSVRATTDGSCATASNEVGVLFAEQDIQGGLYYWQSLVVGGTAGRTGGIFRYDFGNRAAMGEAFLTPASGSCVGCHFLSRDGQRMTYGTDDADSDDEYADLQAHLLDVGGKALLKTSTPGSGKPIPPGFQAFSHDHLKLLASDGENANSTSFFLYNGDQGGMAAGTADTIMRATQPDWSADDRQVVFVSPAKFAKQFQPPYKRADDDHFLGGSLYTMSFDPMGNGGAGQFGPPTLLVKSMGENNYYPSFSPDSPASFIVWNRADVGEMAPDLAKDAFNNPAADVWLLSTKPGAAPIPATRLNLNGAYTNSWPRWSPFVQMYRGNRLLWVTFSSTRDYGLRVRNSVKVPLGGKMVDQQNCYPPDSPQNPNGSHQQPLPENCNQPQIWMAAINLSMAEFGGGDPSFPAFWLPFQEVTAHNHIAQWTQKVVTQPGCDGGACIVLGQPCGGNVCGACCDGLICDTGTCQNPIP